MHHVEARLRAALDAARARGLRFRRGAYGVCKQDGRWAAEGEFLGPIGAFLLHEQPPTTESWVATAAHALGVPYRDLLHFQTGWDCGDLPLDKYGYDGPFFDLGQRLAAEYIDGR